MGIGRVDWMDGGGWPWPDSERPEARPPAPRIRARGVSGWALGGSAGGGRGNQKSDGDDV
jgi:hypothetical protein